jgi:HEAT repeat protein
MAVEALAQPGFPWFWIVADIIAATLLFLNLLLIAAVHGRRIRQFLRRNRARAFQVRLEQILAELDPSTSANDRDWLRRQIARFDELERPLAAVALIERLQPASNEERQRAHEVMRDCGAIDLLERSSSRRMPWRRALAIRTLGIVGAHESLPLLLDRARTDRNRAVRECAVRALGRIGDPRALPLLGEFFRAPGRVGAGVVYDALVSYGPEAEPVLAGALRSELESVRVASVYGVGAVAEPETVRRELESLLSDPSAPVRAAAAEALGHVGGTTLPRGLARATRDEFAAVRKAATVALGSYDDPHAVELAVNALLDADRDTAVRAGESLVRLRRLAAASGPAARAVADGADAWPVERALVFESVGAV